MRLCVCVCVRLHVVRSTALISPAVLGAIDYENSNGNFSL